MPKRVGIYAGSYDPFTYGHLSVVRGACKVFDHVIIAIGVNSRKAGVFKPEQRRTLIEDYLDRAMIDESGLARKCSIDIFEGLLIEYARTHEFSTLIRGLRAVSDFEAEMAIADANRKQEPTIQTIFIPAEADNAFVSSSTVKELALYEGSNLSPYVSDTVAEELRRALREQHKLSSPAVTEFK